MEKTNRVQKAKLNSIITLITQFIQIVIGFVLRRLFINYLGVSYLGYNSVFLNILQMLNLADMGIGVAITSYLYGPLAEDDKDRIIAIMAIYKKIYAILGFVVLFVGIIISAFLAKLIPDATCGIWYLRILFYINLAGTVFTYFLAYKRTLLIADQKSYLSSIFDTGISFAISGLQILFLINWPNYIVYLCLNIAKNVVSNVVVSIKVDKEYQYLRSSPRQNLINEYKPKISQYVRDVFVSKIGSVIYYSTDNVILSVIKGSLLTGYLSNYTMITGYLNTIVSQVLSSLQATFGNYVSTTNDHEAKLRMTDNYFCVNFCIGNFCMICFSLLVQPFIKLFFGENMLLSFSTAMWLGINLMLTFLIQLPSQVFIIYKLFRYDRPIIITSAILNIIISVVLVNKMGVNGVLIGTFVTSLIYLFSRFYIIARYVYAVNYWYYIKKIGIYGIVSILTFLITYFATKNVNSNGIIWFVIRAIAVVMLSIMTTAFFLSFTYEFDFLKNKLIPGKARSAINKISIGVCCIFLIVCSILIGGGYTLNKKTGDPLNKSYIRTDSYVAESEVQDNIFNLTFDDTIDLFSDLSDSNYKSIFENNTLSWAKSLHDEYGVVVTFYTMYESGDFNLSQCPGKYKDEFIANSDWLKFGFHTLNGETSYETGDISVDYAKTINELKRIVGSDSIDNVIRLQSFQGSKEGVSELLSLDEEPVIGLLTADDSRQSYYLDDDENKYIYCHDRMVKDDCYFISTDMRMEYVDSVDKKIKELSSNSWNNQTGDLIIFTHEWALNLETKEKVEKMCQYAVDNGYRFVFFEDVLN